MAQTTASQTIGPYWHIIEDKDWADLTRFGAQGEKLVLTGTIRDGDGAPCPEACVEIWQSDPPASDTFPGFGRANTDATGTFRLTTIRPGPVAGRGNTQQAPHIAICILSRGVMAALMTRAYFAGEALNETDPLLTSIEDPAQRATLIAKPEGGHVWRLDIRLQGEGETVFLDI
ncbi:MAG: protocatechuate 3,4-dioxygenase subunit alpha [Acetobacteraceae bacterium]